MDALVVSNSCLDQNGDLDNSSEGVLLTYLHGQKQVLYEDTALARSAHLEGRMLTNFFKDIAPRVK